MQEINLSMPGISISDVISLMKTAQLEAFIGSEVCQTIDQIGGFPSYDEGLRRVASSLYNDLGRAILSEPNRFSAIIDSLPVDKVKELSNKLSIPINTQMYSQIKNTDVQNSKSLSILFSFFGLNHTSRAPKLSVPSETKIIPNYGLFGHQLGVVNRTIEALNDFPRKALIHMPTGSGKTRTAMHIVAHYAKAFPDSIVVWLASSKELLEQAAFEIERSWTLLGNHQRSLWRYWGDYRYEIDHIQSGFIVAGLAKLTSTVKRNGNVLSRLGDKVSLVIVDEAHQSIAPTYKDVIENLSLKKSTTALLGLTATPGRTWDDIDQDVELSEFYGSRKITLAIGGYDDPVTYLVDEGYLAKAIFSEIDSTNPDSRIYETPTDTDYSERTLTEYGRSPSRNKQIIDIIRRLSQEHKRIIFFGSSVNQAATISCLLNAFGITSNLITAETNTSERDRAIERYKNDSLDTHVICNYGVLTTGFDAPRTSAAVIARPTKSLVLFSQMVGRAIRGEKAGGNKNAEIISVVDTSLPGFCSVTSAFKNWEDIWRNSQ